MAARPRRRTPANPGAVGAAGRTALQRRLDLGLTQADLADLAGVGVSSVRSLEAGQASVSLAIVLAVFDALGLAVAVGPRPALTGTAGVAVLDAGPSIPGRPR